MTSRWTAVYAEFVLYAEHVRVVEIQEIGCATIRVEILFQQFKADLRWILVPLNAIVYRAGITIRRRSQVFHGLAEIMGEGCDSAQSRQVVAQKRDTVELIGIIQDAPRGCRSRRAYLSMR